jgi:hypothetical protein
MKKYKVIISTSKAHELEIDADSKDEAYDIANNYSSKEVEEKSFDSSDVDGFPMVISVSKI